MRRRRNPVDEALGLLVFGGLVWGAWTFAKQCQLPAPFQNAFHQLDKRRFPASDACRTVQPRSPERPLPPTPAPLPPAPFPGPEPAPCTGALPWFRLDYADYREDIELDSSTTIRGEIVFWHCGPAVAGGYRVQLVSGFLSSVLAVWEWPALALPPQAEQPPNRYTLPYAVNGFFAPGVYDLVFEVFDLFGRTIWSGRASGVQVSGSLWGWG